MHILDTVETPDRVAIAFLMRGRHIGAFVSPLGTVAPTHCDIEVCTIDVLTVTVGVISAIWVVSGDLGCSASLMRPGLRDVRTVGGKPLSTHSGIHSLSR
ncbi:MAG: hypothetical protein ACM3ML_05725 [Micromonosporaceae bacterium]